MPVQTFIEINEKEQCEELREYMLGLGASIPQAPTDHYLTDLQQIISICDIIFKVEKESEVEMVLNSIVSVLLFDLEHQATPALVTTFCTQLVKASTPKLAAISFRILQNIFNGFPKNVQIRYRAYTAMVTLCALAGQIKQIYGNLGEHSFEGWF